MYRIRCNLIQLHFKSADNFARDVISFICSKVHSLNFLHCTYSQLHRSHKRQLSPLGKIVRQVWAENCSNLFKLVDCYNRTLLYILSHILILFPFPVPTSRNRPLLLILSCSLVIPRSLPISFYPLVPSPFSSMDLLQSSLLSPGRLFRLSFGRSRLSVRSSFGSSTSFEV